MTEASSPAAPSTTTTTPAQADPATQPSAAAPASPGSAAPSDRPAYVPEKFWDGEKKSVKTEDVFKSYGELEKRLSAPRYDVPAADAPDADKAAFWQKMGVPAKPEDYGLKAPTGYPEHMGEYNQEFMGEFAKTAHGLNLTPQQAAGLQSWYDTHATKLIEGSIAAQKAETDQANSMLSEHFGKLFGDQSTAAVASVKQAMVAAIPDANLRSALEKTLPNEALVAIAALDRHYQKTYGRSDTNAGDNGQTSTQTIAERRAEAQKLMASPEYRDPMHKDHKAAREKVERAYADIGSLTDAARKK